MRSHHPLAAALASALALTLAGCGAPAPAEPEPTVETVEPTPVEPTPTPEPEAQLPEFGPSIVVVSARATASNGAVLALTYFAYEPVESGSDEGQAILAYLKAQGDTSPITTGTIIADEQPLLMPFEITATAEGSTPWPADEGQQVLLGANGESTIVGIPAELPGAVITGPGDGFAVSTITNLPGRPLTVDDWPNRFAFYGFEGFLTEVQLTECSVFVTPYAEQFEVVATQWDVIDCQVGVGD